MSQQPTQVDTQAFLSTLLKAGAEDDGVAALCSLLQHQDNDQVKQLVTRISQEVANQMEMNDKKEAIPSVIELGSSSSEESWEEDLPDASSSPGYTLCKNVDDSRRRSSLLDENCWGSQSIMHVIDSLEDSAALSSSSKNVLNVSGHSFSDRKRTVKFGKVSVREYDIILGDHPPSRQGVSLSIGWEYTSHNSVALKQFEKLRKPNRRRGRDLSLGKQRRELIAKKIGYSQEEIAQNIRSIKKVGTERRQTLNNMGTYNESMELAAAVLKGRTMKIADGLLKSFPSSRSKQRQALS